MAQYCDSAKLEQNWFYWLLSSRVQALEQYRKLNLLWTRVIGIVTDENGTPIQRHGKTIPNPSYPVRTHCIALATPIYFNSYDGIPQQTGVIYCGSKAVRQVLPTDEILNLLSESPLHQLESPFQQQAVVIPYLQSKGYIKEKPTNFTWHAMLEDVNKICHGIAMRFKPRSDEEHHELTNEALIQVINKLNSYKLIYTPGRAPVFNLLTTTIYRVMYSIMNRRKHQREGLSKILQEAEAGTLPKNSRSFRTQTSHRPIKTH